MGQPKTSFRYLLGFGDLCDVASAPWRKGNQFKQRECAEDLAGRLLRWYMPKSGWKLRRGRL